MWFLENENIRFISLAIVILLLMTAGCVRKLYQKYNIPEDNPIEEFIEESIDEVVEENFGFDPEIDITP